MIGGPGHNLLTIPHGDTNDSNVIGATYLKDSVIAHSHLSDNGMFIAVIKTYHGVAK